MATKKKSRKKSTKPKKTARKKSAAAKKSPLKKRPPTKTKKKAASSPKRTQKTSRRRSAPAFSAKGSRSGSGEQSGDLQNLSRTQGADSESVEELLEEGNAFEADAVLGVEDADDAEGKEVRTHEVPEDDVPGEYLDKD